MTNVTLRKEYATKTHTHVHARKCYVTEKENLITFLLCVPNVCTIFLSFGRRAKRIIFPRVWFHHFFFLISYLYKMTITGSLIPNTGSTDYILKWRDVKKNQCEMEWHSLNQSSNLQSICKIIHRFDQWRICS